MRMYGTRKKPDALDNGTHPERLAEQSGKCFSEGALAGGDPGILVCEEERSGEGRERS